jgi:hypothetical protein
MSALFHDVHGDVTPTTTTDVKLSELVNTHVTGRMLDAYQRHTTDVDDMPDTTDTGDVIPEWAFCDGEEDMTFDPWR